MRGGRQVAIWIVWTCLWIYSSRISIENLIHITIYSFSQILIYTHLSPPEPLMSFVYGPFTSGTSHRFQSSPAFHCPSWAAEFHCGCGAFHWGCGAFHCGCGAFHCLWACAAGGVHATGAVPCNNALSQIGKPGHNCGFTPAGKRAGWSCCGAADAFAKVTITMMRTYEMMNICQSNMSPTPWIHSMKLNSEVIAFFSLPFSISFWIGWDIYLFCLNQSQKTIYILENQQRESSDTMNSWTI